jgi:hypothetical protein
VTIPIRHNNLEDVSILLLSYEFPVRFSAPCVNEPNLLNILRKQYYKSFILSLFVYVFQLILLVYAPSLVMGHSNHLVVEFLLAIHRYFLTIISVE